MAQLNTAEQPKATTKLLNEGLIGCDPEFTMTSHGKIVWPFGAFKAELNDWEPKIKGVFGSDGGLFELRPPPRKSAYTLTSNIRDLLLKSNSFLKNPEACRWYANPYWRVRYPCGGHIHFEGKHSGAGDGAATTISYLIEKADIIPDSISKARRRQYGGWGSRNDHQKHWEFRLLGTWLFHPRVTFIVLTLMKLSQIDPKFTGVDMAASRPWLSLLNLAKKYQSEDADAARVVKLMELGPEKVLANPIRNFLPHWQKWTPNEDSGS